MELEQFLTKYPEWVNRNGITAQPEIKKAEWTGVANVEPPTLMIYTNSVGFTLTMGAQVILSQPQTMPLQGLIALRSHFGKPSTGPAEVSWEDFINPPAPSPGAVTGIGPAIPKEVVSQFVWNGRVDVSRKYFQLGTFSVEEGMLVNTASKQYLCVNPGSMFTRWLMEL
jgi:hypothetical protein